jgi:hypothetical protein
MYDYENLDVNQWRSVLKIRQRALCAYTMAAIKYEDLPAAEELVAKELETQLTPDELDVLQNALIKPELTILHSWNPQPDEMQGDDQPDEGEQERSQEDELMDREDASNAGLLLNNVVDMNNTLIKIWLLGIAKNSNERDTKNVLNVLALMNDSSFLLSFVLDSIARGYKDLALALVANVRSNTDVVISALHRDFDVTLLMPPDFPDFERDFISTQDMLLRSLQRLDNADLN